MAALVLLSVTLAVATGVLAWYVDRSRRQLDRLMAPVENETSSSLCTSVECVASAGRLIDAMDTRVDPCHDFYQFACGGWIQRHPIPAARTSWSQLSRLDYRVSTAIRQLVDAESDAHDAGPVNSSRRMYRACIDTARCSTRGRKPVENQVKLGQSQFESLELELNLDLDLVHYNSEIRFSSQLEPFKFLP